MSDCVFCAIIGGQIPAELLHQDELCVAFADIAPKAPIHLLVVPRQHLSGAPDLSVAHEALAGRLLSVAASLAKQRGLDKGYRLVINSGTDGGQLVGHLHLHLLGGRRLGELG